jgi:hypothetical protein
MRAAVDRYQRELLTLVDTPYDLMSCPTSPARFNRQLQLRVGRASKQAGVALRANYAPCTASGVFKGTRLANEEFVRRMLIAAGAEDKEQAVWLEWRLQLAREPRPVVSSATRVAPTRRLRWLKWAASALIFAIVVVGLTGAAVRSAPNSSHPGNMRLDVESRAPPTTEGSYGPSMDVPTAEGTPSAEKVRATTAPTPPTPSSQVTPDGVRTWKATINGDQTDPVYVVCFTTKTEPKGWYYTDRGDYLDPAIVRFSGDDRNAVPPCNKVAFPENGMTPMPNDPSYSRNTKKRHSDKR